MKRLLYNRLLVWKNKKDRMPLVLSGARQIGKTYLLKYFGENEYKEVHIFNFQESPGLCRLFKKDLNPKRIIEELSVIQKKNIDIHTELVFFDEIQECDEALTSLKYFCENLPELHIAAAGSLLGIKLNASSFPVGKVDLYYMYPMSFGEFLEASADETAIRLYNGNSLLESSFDILWEYLRQYYYVGGMPGAVKKWFSDAGINERIEAVRKIQKDILTGYEKDFSKHSGKINALHISTVLKNIPSQMSAALDGSVKRYRFKDVIPKRRTYTDLSGPISWLESAGLVYKVYDIEGRPRIPLKAFVKENIFKIFLFDIGILGAMLDLSYESLMEQDYGTAKGFFAENYVACEFKASGIESLYSWSESKAEIEFLFVSGESKIYPVEVKSGKRVQAKSLGSYIQRYSPEKTIKLAGLQIESGNKNLILPLYYAGKLNSFI